MIIKTEKGFRIETKEGHIDYPSVESGGIVKYRNKKLVPVDVQREVKKLFFGYYRKRG